MDKQKITSHTQLTVWQKAMDLVSGIYEATKGFPKDEQFGLTSQMRRCAISIPSNIAEGRVRRTTKDFVHFLHISLGSTAELNTQLEIARRQKFLSGARYTELVGLLDEVGRMLSALISSLNAKL